MTPIYQKNYIVPESDVNLAKHVDNKMYLHWMLDTAFEYFEQCGWSFEKQVDLGQCFYVKSHFIEYLAPAFEDDKLIFLTWLSVLEGKRVTMNYKFFKAEDMRPLLKAETQWVLVEMESGRSTLIPDRMKSDLHAVSEDEIEAHLSALSV